MNTQSASAQRSEWIKQGRQQTVGGELEIGRGPKSWAEAVLAGVLVAGWFGSALLAIAGTELRRRVAPGKRLEERHQFESPEMRTGTWGRIY